MVTNVENPNELQENSFKQELWDLKKDVSKLHEKGEQIEGRNLYEELKNFDFEKIFEQPQWKDKWFKRIKPWLEKTDEYWKYIEINGEKYYDGREILSESNTKNKNEKILVYYMSDGKYGTSVQLYEINEKYQMCGKWLLYGINWDITSITNLY